MNGGPRNKLAFARGQAIRAEIRTYLLGLHPLARRPTWKEIQAHLRTRNHHLERSAICHHVQQIEIEAELDRSLSDSSPDDKAA